MTPVWGRGVIGRARTRAALGVVVATVVFFVTAAPASAQLIDAFATTGNAQARWIKDPAAPSGATEQESIALRVTATSALDFNDAAWVRLLGVPSAPPATAPSFLYKVSRVAASGGSVRLVMRFSDGGLGFLRPVTLQAGRWVRADGAANDWESRGGTACASSGISYAAMLACHPGARVRSLDIINDSGWLHSGSFQAEVDNISYGSEVVSKPSPPLLGRSVNVARVSGRVVVSLPHGGGQAQASQRRRRRDRDRVDGTIQGLPVGSHVDARRGTVRLISSRGRRRRQSGRFSGGVFTVGQIRKGRRRGLTTLRLQTSSRRRCNTRGARRSQTGSPHADASRRRRGLLRRLRARARGRFRTRGRYSSAIVQGTIWTIEDRCEGTLVRVREGKVAVRDTRRKRTVIVRAGQSYLAKAPGY